MRPILILLLLASTAHAVGTRTFRITSYKDFDEGESTGVLLSSLGEAGSGYGSSRLDVGESAVSAAVSAPDGTVWLGTGDQAQVYLLQKGKLKKGPKLDGVMVTSLALGPSGTVFAGVMPGGRVFALDPSGKSRELAKLEAEHVWSLAYDEGKQLLYAATGPDGKLFAIDARNLDRGYVGNRARLLAEIGEKHLLSMTRGDDGALYVGSADQAILFRVQPDGKVTAVHDFEGDEVRAIARKGATLYVAVNEFQKSGTATPPPTVGPRGTKIVLPTTATPAPTGLPARDKKGKGAVYRVDPDGRVEQLHALADGYFTALHADGDGNVWAAGGSNGKVYLIRPDRTVLTAFDLPERQVLALALDGSERVIGTGDAGAVYRLANDPPKDAAYTTKVLDGQFHSRWGNVRWAGSSGLSLLTRSGNTSKPDKTWSAWQAPQKSEKLPDGGVGRVASPEARYLQVKVAFAQPRTTLRDLTVYYQPQNQRARLTELTVNDDVPGKRPAPAGKPRSPLVKVKWKTDNPDDDELVYRLFFREESELNWKPLGGPEPITRSEYEWNTEPIPDGNYVLKVVASDERANPRETALEHALTSSPFLVDNRKPEVADLKVAWPYVSGHARDSFSPISDLAYSVDGGEWQPIAPRDGVLDDPAEDFTVKLSTTLAAGAHSIAVRATDSAGNVGAVQSSFRIK